MAGCKTRPFLSHGIVTLGWPLVDIMVTTVGNLFFKANGLLLDTVKMFVEREGNRVELTVTPDAGKYAASADAGIPFVSFLFRNDDGQVKPARLEPEAVADCE
jgi:hypothetical protein